MTIARIKRLWRERRGTVIGLAAALALVGGFALLASEVIEDETQAFDLAILRAFRGAGGQPVGPAWFQTAIVNLSALGSTAVVTLVVTIASAFLLLVGRARQALLVIVCAVGAGLAVVVLKDYVGRPRPSVVVVLDPTGGLSFPSGHSLGASAIYPMLGILLSTAFEELRLKVFVLAMAVALALLIGFTRIFLGVHYPTDVIAGWMLGSAWTILCGLVGRGLQRKGLVEQEGG